MSLSDGAELPSDLLLGACRSHSLPAPHGEHLPLTSTWGGSWGAWCAASLLPCLLVTWFLVYLEVRHQQGKRGKASLTRVFPSVGHPHPGRLPSLSLFSSLPPAPLLFFPEESLTREGG